MENSWMDEESRDKAVDKAENLVEIIGAPSNYLNDSVFDMYVKDEDVSRVIIIKLQNIPKFPFRKTQKIQAFFLCT